jgi:Alanine racemase, N-terminal domain
VATTVVVVTIRLAVRTALWRSHVAGVVNSVDGLVPVIKGNGYGFGRLALARLAAEFTDTVAVGTVHELADLPDGLHAVVLTPTLAAPTSTAPILTVGNRAHVEALRGWPGRVIVKIASSMQRYGRGPELFDEARRAGLDVVGASVHPPLAGTADDHRREIVGLLERIDPATPVWVSHLDPTAYEALPPTHSYRLRLGTWLWHGDKSFLQLDADVLDVRPVSRGQRAGYRQEPAGATGHLVMIGAGTANGVTTLPDGRSPFHFRRQRLDLLEAPHMHTSMALIRNGDPVPDIGDHVDLQRPLTTTLVDEYVWR